ncbi:DUF1045 domain-containing protein [Phaeobacter gallaeciensis]|uniref:DUF1045 domain-containing protein n=1 Tax=Phaeobacter gallaeciensis TaxID=60890 RepID=UPI000BBB9BBC|nr:DUF1045 domain-containing protein [Phaeobacter gallaeciensis]ATF19538.1 putative phosphonate metabolism protein [Phaeobacter gallaeciensis]ATF23647.1 putative phosphonate metabolism protein [Phaeobacter gallaeciensis]
MTFTRYAIYYVPPKQAEWSRFASSWLGWDIHEGSSSDHPTDTGLDVATITDVPRKYGLHATIKPPFRLAEGTTFDALAERFAQFTTAAKPVTLEGLSLTRLGRFLVLCPTGDQLRLNRLAFGCVRDLDEFRAPATTDELEKRRAGGLSPAQEQALVTWGYPYVGDSFRFHITLSGKRPKTELPAIEAVLQDRLVPQLPKPFVIGDLALVGEDSDRRFHMVHRHALSG